MNNIKKTITYITLGLIILTFFMNFINDIISFIDLSKIPSSPLKNFTIWMTVIDLLTTIAICIIAGVGLYNYAKFYIPDSNENFLIAPIFVYALASHLVDGITISYFKLILSGISIALIIFSILSFLSCFMALVISNSAAKKALAVSGFIFAFIYIIISLSQNGSALETFSIVIFVFLLLSMVIDGIALLLPSSKSYLSYGNYHSSTTDISSESTDKTDNDSEPDPYEQLIKLKKLYNQKIISKSEYEEKKKKYTERL